MSSQYQKTRIEICGCTMHVWHCAVYRILRQDYRGFPTTRSPHRTCTCGLSPCLPIVLTSTPTGLSATAGGKEATPNICFGIKSKVQKAVDTLFTQLACRADEVKRRYRTPSIQSRRTTYLSTNASCRSHHGIAFVKDVAPENDGSHPVFLSVLDDIVYFFANDLSLGHEL